MRRSIILAALPLLAACQQQPGDTKLVAPTRAEAEKIVAATDASYTTGKVDEIMGHYADNAVMFDQGLLAPVADRQLQTKLTQGFAASQPRDLTTANRQIQVLDADTFIDSGVASFTIQLGQSRQPVRVRFTDVYQRQPDNNWKIVHEHMSAPPAGSPLP